MESRSLYKDVNGKRSRFINFNDIKSNEIANFPII